MNDGTGVHNPILDFPYRRFVLFRVNLIKHELNEKIQYIKIYSKENREESCMPPHNFGTVGFPSH